MPPPWIATELAMAPVPLSVAPVPTVTLVLAVMAPLTFNWPPLIEVVPV
jgi:hypothetical protein